jgi:hypothetical protein
MINELAQQPLDLLVEHRHYRFMMIQLLKNNTRDQHVDIWHLYQDIHYLDSLIDRLLTQQGR